MDVVVETYSGHRLHEQPRRFRIEGRWKNVVKVLSSRRHPDTLVFMVLADDGQNYLLEYNPHNDAWRAVLSPSPSRSFPPE
ncbi:MAG: hypothetical protein ACUVXF_02175 [Desulfobaccales bacterium]